LFKKPEQKKAYYKGLQTCGSVHSCPICAVKISEYRKQEIEDLLEKSKDFYHYMITLTVPHYSDQSCQDVRKKFMDARRKVKKRRSLKKEPDFIPYKKIMDHHHYDGSVTTVEVTYGKNGWHVHSHEMIILKKRVEDLPAFREMIYQNWKKSVELSGIEIKDYRAFNLRSVKIDELKGDHINKMTTYLTKIDSAKHWGMAAELAKGIMKKSDNNNVTPFGMLHKINDEKDPEEKRKLFSFYAPKFFEYCQAFKGKNFIIFSKGLKKKYEIIEIKDEEIVNAEDLMKDHYGFFEKPEWQLIKKYRLRGFVIQNSEGPWADLQDLLNKKINQKKWDEKTNGTDKRQRNFAKTG